MVTIIVCYIAGAAFTYFLIAALRGYGLMDKETCSISALVGAVAWPFTLTALVGFLILWRFFNVIELLFYTAATYFRGRK